ncbi:hypothetical protein [Streptomyces sp. NPDC051636]|uniref:hypothetical protein n=1 Tax=Streptomyces sp. NPDC051636 TaxID=3365663 RepID=UPI0037B9BB96
MRGQFAYGDADGDDRLTERDDQQQSAPLHEVRRVRAAEPDPQGRGRTLVPVAGAVFGQKGITNCSSGASTQAVRRDAAGQAGGGDRQGGRRGGAFVGLEALVRAFTQGPRGERLPGNVPDCRLLP